MGGLFGDLPPESTGDAGGKEAGAGTQAAASAGGWSIGGSRMAPPALFKPMFAPPSALRRAQAQAQGSTAGKSGKPVSSLSAEPGRSGGHPNSQASSGAQEEHSVSARDTGAESVFKGGGNVPSVFPITVQAQKQPEPSVHLGQTPMPAAAGPSGAAALVAANIVDEYDPARPNDYEEILRERKRKKQEEEMERELERRRREQEEREKERERELQRQREIQLAMQAEKERAAAALGGAGGASSEGEGGFARVQASSGEEAWRRRAMLSGARPPPSYDAGGGSSPPRQEESAAPAAPQKPLTAAERMMMKMGWKAGQGLGKQEQGITTPLMAKKTDKRGGVIVNAPERKAKQAQQQQLAARPASSLANSTPTKVVLLRNMVGPGEVDEELEEEVAGECQKYGTVSRVLIFEVTEPDFPPHEAVRILICFERMESAVKAAIDLDGRFFGGRAVRASYFSEKRFEQKDLAPSLEELEQM